MTAGRYGQAELLVALWKLGSQEPMLPTSHGILDRALNAMKEKLPPELGSLSFSPTSIGLRCYELPDILLAAQEAMLISDLSALVTISEDVAKEIVLSHGVDIDEAIRVGSELSEEATSLCRGAVRVVA